MFFHCVHWAFSDIGPSWFSSHSIIRFDLGINRRPDLCLGCVLSSIWTSTKHYLKATNRPHWSSISVLYFQRYQRWPIFNQLRANVFWLIILGSPISVSNWVTWTDGPQDTALWRIERGVAVSAPPLWYVPKTKTQPYKASIISANIFIIRPFEAL